MKSEDTILNNRIEFYSDGCECPDCGGELVVKEPRCGIYGYWYLHRTMQETIPIFPANSFKRILTCENCGETFDEFHQICPNEEI